MTAVVATGLATQQLKTSVDRQRPNEIDDDSFPSGHASTTAVFTRLTSRNLAWNESGNRARRTIDLGLNGVAIVACVSCTAAPENGRGRKRACRTRKASGKASTTFVTRSVGACAVRAFRWKPERTLLGHANGDITTYYSAAEIEELRRAVQRIVNPRVVQAPTLMIVRKTRTGVGKTSANEKELARDAR